MKTNDLYVYGGIALALFFLTKNKAAPATPDESEIAASPEEQEEDAREAAGSAFDQAMLLGLHVEDAQNAAAIAYHKAGGTDESFVAQMNLWDNPSGINE